MLLNVLLLCECAAAARDCGVKLMPAEDDAPLPDAMLLLHVTGTEHHQP